MRNLSKSLVLSLGLSLAAFAADPVPTDHKGGVTLPEYAGAKACEITSSTGTTPMICDLGPSVILRVIGSSVAASDQLVFRDSATANGTSTVLFSLDKGSLLETNQVYPKFVNGLDVKAMTAPGGAGPAVRPAWTIIYRELDKN